MATAVPGLTRTAKAAGLKIDHVATNGYPWMTFARRAKVDFTAHNDELLSRIADTCVTGYEPIINSPGEFDGLGEKLQRHGLQMRSLYVNNTLHDVGKAEQSIASALAIAKRAWKLGTRIIVTNPSPIRWGGSEDKTD